MTNTIKYFLYARKSSEGEDRQITSIDDQVSEMTKLARTMNFEIVDVISESKSAKEPGREKFNEMMARIKKGEAQGILCWKLNRLARNPVDGGDIIWNLQKNIIQHIQTYGRDYKPTDNVIMMYVEFGMSNQYVNDLSIDTKRGMRKKAERGWYPISKLPVGYIHNPNRVQGNNEPEIITDPRTFRKMKKLWNLLLTGIYSISEIKREGDALGLVNSKGNFYPVNSYHYIFSNEFYCGYYHWNDENGNKVRYLGKHKPMISELEYRKVQDIYRKNSRPTRKKTYTFPYRGLIACGECNGFVTAENKLQAICTYCKFKFSIKTRTGCPKCKIDVSEMENPSIIDKTYYHCTKKVKKDCSQGAITDVDIDAFLLKKLKQISINKEFFNFAIRGLKMLNETDNHKDDKVLISLKKRKTQLASRIQSLVQMRADHEITKEQLQQLKLSTGQEIRALELKILSMEYIKVNWLKVAQETIDYTFNSLKKFKNGDESIKKLIASKIGSNLTLKDKSLYFKRLEPHLRIKECAKAFTKEKDKLEPKNPIGNKGDHGHFDALFPVMLPHLNDIRTCLIDNFKNNLA